MTNAILGVRHSEVTNVAVFENTSRWVTFGKSFFFFLCIVFIPHFQKVKIYNYVDV